MWTHHAERLVPAEPSAVRTAIAALVDELWGDRSRTLLADDERTDAVAPAPGSDDVDVWVTWRVTDRADGTSVEVTLDELEAGPNPDLHALLQALGRRISTSPPSQG